MPKLPGRSISLQNALVDLNKCLPEPTVNSLLPMIARTLLRLASLVMWVKKPKFYGAYLQSDQKLAQQILHVMSMAGQ